MNIVVSLDYEIWFGRNGSPPQQTLVEPTEALAQLARRLGIRLVLFVDATWLWRLRQEARRHASLMGVYYRVMRQLEALAEEGHELQLHLHPHWVDSHWDGDGWVQDLRRYRLHDFSDAEIVDLVCDGAETLRALSQWQSVSAFRAGGWCLQPFERLALPLKAAGISIDSTVYAQGREAGAGRRYDFTAAPALSRWRFELDPLQPVDDGHFLEVPIASQTLSPAFFWRLAMTRMLRSGEHRRFGDGAAMPMSRADLWRKLTQASTSVVSLDGLKATTMRSALADHRRRGLQDFVIVGHPKALTQHALRRLELFVHAHRGDHFMGLNDYLAERPAASAADPMRSAA